MPAPMLTIEVAGFERLGRALSPGIVGGPLRDLLQKAARETTRVAHDKAPRDTGALRRSITPQVKPLSARVFTRRGAAYFPVMEFGRRPGKKMPPPQALKGWARRHGFPTTPGALFALARSIGRRGIKGRFFMRAAKQAGNRQMPGWLRTMGKDIGVDFGSTR